MIEHTRTWHTKSIKQQTLAHYWRKERTFFFSFHPFNSYLPSLSFNLRSSPVMFCSSFKTCLSMSSYCQCIFSVTIAQKKNEVKKKTKPPWPLSNMQLAYTTSMFGFRNFLHPDIIRQYERRNSYVLFNLGIVFLTKEAYATLGAC